MPKGPNGKKRPADVIGLAVNVEKSSVVSTDELLSYSLLTGDGYIHGAVKHAAKEWTHTTTSKA